MYNQKLHILKVLFDIKKYSYGPSAGQLDEN